MAIAKNNVPSGEIIIKDFFTESSSGHTEISEKQTLAVSDNKIVFIDTSEKINFYKMGSAEKSYDIYEIPITKFIDLFREHGLKREKY